MSAASSSGESPSLPSASLTTAVMAGLAVGIALIAVFSIWHSQAQTATNLQQQMPGHGISTVVIPPSSSLAAANKTFEPNIIQIVVGLNNTVRWNNQDTSRITITSYPNVTDSSFYLATIPPLSKTLSKGDSFEFTFNKPGEYQYHAYDNSSKSGSIIVLPKEYKTFEPYRPKITEEQAIKNVLDFLKQKVQSIESMKIYGLSADGSWHNNTRLSSRDLYHTPEEFKGGKFAIPLRYSDYLGRYHVSAIRINDSYEVTPCAACNANFPHPPGRLIYLVSADFNYSVSNIKGGTAAGGGNNTDTTHFFGTDELLVDALNGEIIYSGFQPYS